MHDFALKDSLPTASSLILGRLCRLFSLLSFLFSPLEFLLLKGKTTGRETKCFAFVVVIRLDESEAAAGRGQRSFRAKSVFAR